METEIKDKTEHIVKYFDDRIKHIDTGLSYKDNYMRNVILAAKKLDTSSISECADIVMSYLAKNIDHDHNISKILLLNTPSSAYAAAKKPKDHMVEILKIVEENMKYMKIYDFIPHLFMIKITKRDSQHNSSRRERIENAGQRFYIPKIDKSPRLNRGLKKILRKYKEIWIIDDIYTTGATLNALSELLMKFLYSFDETLNIGPAPSAKSKHGYIPRIITFTIAHG